MQQEIRLLIEFIYKNKNNHDIKSMYTFLSVSRSRYYKSFDKTKSERELENEELKAAIIRIYKANKGSIELQDSLYNWYRGFLKKGDQTRTLLNNCKKI